MLHSLRLATVILLSAGGASHAQSPPPSVFDAFLTGSASCVPVAPVEKLGAVVKLSKEQFRFAEALYVALPPISKALPPGDAGELIGGEDGTAILLLVDGDQSCARFQVPDFMLKIFNDISSGKVEHVGKGA